MNSPLASPAATRKVLDRHGFHLKKSLGQNFLVNDDVVGKILELADVDPGDVVLEVGPGIGTLTSALLGAGAKVIAVERDKALPDVLADTLLEHDGDWALIAKDALDVCTCDIESAAASIGCSMPSKLVSNLPYAVAATVVLKYFQEFPFIESETVMVQREVAERMQAGPYTKNYGAYTVKLSMFAEAAGSFRVGPGNFMPPPHVESAVVRLDRVDSNVLLAESCGEVGNEAAQVVRDACTMADASFAARRKTIANSCKQYFAGRNASVIPELADIFEDAGIDPGLRGEALSRSDYLRLGKALAFALVTIAG